MQPLQNIHIEEDGTARFIPNSIVRYLLDLCTEKGICDMNRLAVMQFSRQDRSQFAQLIGYSVSGFSELSYVSNKERRATERQASKLKKERESQNRRPNR